MDGLDAGFIDCDSVLNLNCSFIRDMVRAKKFEQWIR